MSSAKNIINGFYSSKQFEAEMKRVSQTNNRLTAATGAVQTVGATMIPIAAPIRYGVATVPTEPIYNAPYRTPIAVPVRPRTSRWSGGKQKTKKKRNKRKGTVRKKHKINKKMRKTSKSTQKTIRKNHKNKKPNTRKKIDIKYKYKNK
jgi:hypothetical protein